MKASTRAWIVPRTAAGRSRSNRHERARRPRTAPLAGGHVADGRRWRRRRQRTVRRLAHAQRAARALGADVEFGMASLEPHALATLEWRGKPAWAMRRTAEMLAALRVHDESLADPRSNRLDQQPGCARNETRSIEPHLDCIRRSDRRRADSSPLAMDRGSISRVASSRTFRLRVIWRSLRITNGPSRSW
jgi:hypothetical protein